MLKRLFFLPKEHIVSVIPILLIFGFFTGLIIDTASLKHFILPVTVLMIYPTMIGFQPAQLVNLAYGKLILASVIINFLFIPLLAYIIGSTLFVNEPQLFAGLAISALLPTGNMTIAFTMLANGNVPAAIKLTVISLIMGSLLAPWYLLLMVGKYVPIDVLATMKTIVIVVFLPMTLGILTYNFLLARYTKEEFNKKIKPVLPAISSWGMVFIIFASISFNAERIAHRWELVWLAIAGQLLFYLINFLLATFTARKLFNRADGYALVYSTVLRNLSISIGLAATTFGPDAALIVSIAFLIQQQGAAWFARLNKKFNFLPDKQELKIRT